MGYRQSNAGNAVDPLYQEKVKNVYILMGCLQRAGKGPVREMGCHERGRSTRMVGGGSGGREGRGGSSHSQEVQR